MVWTAFVIITIGSKEAGFIDLYVGYQHPSCFDYDMKSMDFDFGVESNLFSQ